MARLYLGNECNPPQVGQRDEGFPDTGRPGVACSSNHIDDAKPNSEYLDNQTMRSAMSESQNSPTVRAASIAADVWRLPAGALQAFLYPAFTTYAKQLFGQHVLATSTYQQPTRQSHSFLFHFRLQQARCRVNARGAFEGKHTRHHGLVLHCPSSALHRGSRFLSTGHHLRILAHLFKSRDLLPPDGHPQIAQMGVDRGRRAL